MEENTEVTLPKELTPEAKDRLKQFDPAKPLIINSKDIPSLSHLSGRFVFKRPTLGDQLTVGVQSAKLRENLQLDTATDTLAYIIATFGVVCKEKPKDFSFEDSFDLEPVFDLYGRYIEWVGFFRLTLQERQERIS